MYELLQKCPAVNLRPTLKFFVVAVLVKKSFSMIYDEKKRLVLTRTRDFHCNAHGKGILK